MNSRRTLPICTALAVGVAVAAALEGTTRFTGPRWVPDWHQSPRQTPRPTPTLPQVSAHPQAPPTGGGGGLAEIVVWVVVAIAVVAIALLLWHRLRRLRARTAPTVRGIGGLTSASPDLAPAPEPEPDVPAVRRGVEYALQLLDEEREPADAVIRAWLGLQQTAEDSGIVRGPAETPTEFTSRIMRRALADYRAVTTLLNLYLRTRFGDHPVTAADVAQVREALRELAGSWDADAGSAARRG